MTWCNMATTFFTVLVFSLEKVPFLQIEANQIHVVPTSFLYGMNIIQHPSCMGWILFLLLTRSMLNIKAYV